MGLGRWERTGGGSPGRTGSALLALAAFCFLAVPPCRAGDGVGMEALGVDPSAAVQADRWGLDIRDALNRPVSAARLEADLKSAAAQAAASASFDSTLPHARAAVLLREFLPAVEDVLRSILPGLCVSTAAAAGVPKPPRLFPILAALVLFTLLPAASLRLQQEPTGAASRCPAILRC